MATLYHQVCIDAPIEKIYEALATAEGLSRWWIPHTSSQTSAGLVLAHGSPGDDENEVRLKVLEATPPARIVWEVISEHPQESAASAWTGTRIVFELSERPSPGVWMGLDNDGETMTVVDFRHSGWDEESAFIGFCNYAWGVTLEELRKQAEAG